MCKDDCASVHLDSRERERGWLWPLGNGSKEFNEERETERQRELKRN